MKNIQEAMAMRKKEEKRLQLGVRIARSERGKKLVEKRTNLVKLRVSVLWPQMLPCNSSAVGREDLLKWLGWMHLDLLFQCLLVVGQFA